MKEITNLKKTPSILLLDLETAPNIGFCWGKWEQNIIEMVQDWFILSFGFKWLGDKKTQVKALPDYPLYKKNKTNDKELVKELWQLFDQADLILAHHGDGFDIKKSNARFIFHGLQPPSPYKSIDTLKIARKYFKFDSNKLDDLAKYLNIGRKLPHEGFHTWKGCLEGNLKAWEIMRRYNAHDVDLLEEVYLRLRSWATTHPNLDNYSKNNSCPTCQSIRIQRRGVNVSKTGYKERFQCQDCGAWFSGNKYFKGERLEETEISSNISDKELGKLMKKALKD